MLRVDPNEKLKLDEQYSIFLNSTSTSPKAIVGIRTKAYVNCLSENDRMKRDMSTVFSDQNNEFDNNKLTILVSITDNGNPPSDEEVTNRDYIDDEFNADTMLRFNETLQNHLKVSVGNNGCNLTKYDTKHIIDATIIKIGIFGDYLVPLRKKERKDKNIADKVTKLKRVSKKLKALQETPELVQHRVSEIVLCTLKQPQLILGKMFLLVLNE